MLLFYAIYAPFSITVKEAFYHLIDDLSESEYEWLCQRLKIERFEEEQITGDEQALATLFRYILLADKQHADSLGNPFVTAARLIKESKVTTDPNGVFDGGTLCFPVASDVEEEQES